MQGSASLLAHVLATREPRPFDLVYLAGLITEHVG